LTSELERIKILEGKISHVVDYVNKLLQENEKLKQQVRELRTEKKDFEEQARKAGKFGEDLKKYEKEREIIKEKIETVINQIDQLGI
jgi:cell division septum initiation protein DivIVA